MEIDFSKVVGTMETAPCTLRSFAVLSITTRVCHILIKPIIKWLFYSSRASCGKNSKTGV